MIKPEKVHSHAKKSKKMKKLKQKNNKKQKNINILYANPDGILGKIPSV